MKNNEENTSIKEAAIRFDEFIRDGGVGSSLFFVLILLIIVNAHSLHFLLGDGVLNWVFSVVGAIGFSIATTAVVRKPVAIWMKFTFPLFDTLLVYLGFNTLSEVIPVHDIMTILFALFTGTILVSLGTINYVEQNKEAEETDFKSEIERLEKLVSEYRESKTKLEVNKSELESKIESLNVSLENAENEKSKLKSDTKEQNLLETEVNKLRKRLNDTLTDFENYKTDYELKQSEFESLQSKFLKNEALLNDYKFQITELDKYKHGYLLAEKSRILKKKEENRTAEEINLLEMIEQTDR